MLGCKDWPEAPQATSPCREVQGSTGALSRRVGEAQGAAAAQAPQRPAPLPSPLATPRGQLRPCSQHGPAEKPGDRLAEARPSGARGPARLPSHRRGHPGTRPPRPAQPTRADAPWGSGYRARGDPPAAVWEQDQPPWRQRSPTVCLASTPREAPLRGLAQKDKEAVEPSSQLHVTLQSGGPWAGSAFWACQAVTHASRRLRPWNTTTASLEPCPQPLPLPEASAGHCPPGSTLPRPPQCLPQPPGGHFAAPGDLQTRFHSPPRLAGHVGWARRGTAVALHRPAQGCP